MPPAAARGKARIRQMDLNDLKEQGLFLPPVEKVYVELPEPDNQDHLPDVTRLVSHLKLHHDEHRLTVSLPVIRKVPDVLRKDGFRVTATLARPVMDSGKTEIINVQPGTPPTATMPSPWISAPPRSTVSSST
jgi:hypothetical protein